MARTVVVHITDDIDGSKGAEEVQFALRGVEYSIDLSKKNQAALAKVLKPYIDAGTKVSSRIRRGGGRRPSTPGSQDQRAVRQWAKAQGLEVSDRGRIPASIVAQYASRNG